MKEDMTRHIIAIAALGLISLSVAAQATTLTAQHAMWEWAEQWKPSEQTCRRWGRTLPA